ncbi:MAG: TadE/TadG family type IV pilus assembly protein [Alphaproteobacteria bacterium]
MGWVNGSFGGGRRFLARFVGERRGNVAIIFGLSLIPLLIAAGAAVDLSRALVVRARLAQALDAAGLAAGATPNLSLSQMQDLATKYFNANYPADKLGVPGAIQVSVTNKVVTMSATAELQTSLMYLVGIDHLNVGVSNEITAESKGLELAMVLDTTGSMASSGKIEALRSAATDLVNILSGGNNFPTKLKIGLVPFAMTVRLDPTAAVNSDWMDTDGNASNAQLNFSGGKYAYWMYTDSGGLSNTSWLGCVEAPNWLDGDGHGADGRKCRSKWVPWFQLASPNINDPENPSNPLCHRHRQFQSVGRRFQFHQYIVIPNTNIWCSSLTQNTTNISVERHADDQQPRPLDRDGAGRDVELGHAADTPSASTAYWVIRNSSGTIKLATSAANAMAGTAVNITAVGSGTLSLTGAAYTNDTLLIVSAWLCDG